MLLIGHASASEQGAITASSAWPNARIDLIGYGRAPGDTPPPQGTRPLKLPAAEPRAVAAFLCSLRASSYGLAAVCQPRLEVSRARGALLGLAVASGARAVVTIDPETGRVRRTSRRAALVDALAFGLVNVAAHGAVPVATAAVRGLSRLPTRSPVGHLPHGGRVTYLRSDLDLALAPLTAGGSLAHTEGILRALQRRPHPVELWTSGGLAGMPPEVPQRPLPTLLWANVPWELAELLSGVAQAVRLLRDARPTAFVYQRYSLNNLAGVILAIARRVPLVLEANASEVVWREQWSSLQFPGLARACEKLVLQHSDRVATVSSNAAEDLLPAGADPTRIRVVPNGVDVNRFRGVQPRRLPFGKGEFVIGFSGLFYPWHGARWLAEAFALVYGRRPDARLLLVGDGEDAPLVRSILARGGVSDTALLTGLVPRDEVPGYLAAADVLVSPHAANDGFIGSPIKVWEYMASGRAIVASDVAQIGEVLRHRETALIVPPENAEALAAALVELRDDPGLRARLGAAAAAEAASNHSWDARLASALAETG